MLYTVAEVSNLTNLSKVSIYNKLKLKELQEHTSKKQGITYIDDTGLNLIQESLKSKDDDLKFNTNDLNDLNNKDIDDSPNVDEEPIAEDLSLKDDYINYLKAENERLWQELQNANDRLETEQELTKNMQVLHLRQQQPDIKELESHFKEVDDKLLDIRNQMKQRKEDYNKKGIFQKIFNKQSKT